MDSGEFITTDMYFAAALMAYGAELKSVDKTNKSRQKFVFLGKILKVLIHTDTGFFIILESPSFAEIKSKYESKRLFFPPSYPDAMRTVKSAIHS